MKAYILPMLAVATLVAFAPAKAAETEPAHTVELVPAFKLTDADLAMLKDNHKVLKENQALVRKILEKEHLEVYQPEIPHFQIMSENSLLALLNQLEYLELCHKVGVPKPPRPTLETGTPMQNNRFLHAYNDALLQAIAKKLGIAQMPAVDLETGSVAEQDNRLVKQNSALLHKIAEHFGIKP